MSDKIQKNKPRHCIFCGETSTTKEHLFPQWMREYVPETSYPAKHEQFEVRREVDTGHQLYVTQKGKLERAGDRRSRSLRVVCGCCNNGWMSRLQVEAKPLLLLFLQGKWKPITKIDQEILARWAVMFTIVRERVSFEGGVNNEMTPSESAILQSDRDFMRVNNKIPTKNWCVSIGSFGPRPANCLSITRRFDLNKQTGINTFDCSHFQSTVLAAGNLFMHIFSATNDSLFRHAFAASKSFYKRFPLQRIWPISGVKTTVGIKKREDITFDVYQNLCEMFVFELTHDQRGNPLDGSLAQPIRLKFADNSPSAQLEFRQKYIRRECDQ